LKLKLLRFIHFNMLLFQSGRLCRVIFVHIVQCKIFTVSLPPSFGDFVEEIFGPFELYRMDNVISYMYEK
jgi:hypothetical protein